MPNVNSKINFMVGTSESFDNLQTKDTDTLYFLTDTHQIFVGADEYTKSVRFLNAVPTSSTEGVEGIVAYLIEIVDHDDKFVPTFGHTACDNIVLRIKKLAVVNEFAENVKTGAGGGECHHRG